MRTAATASLRAVRGDVLVLLAAMIFAITTTIIKVVVSRVNPLFAAWVRFGVPSMVLLALGALGWMSFDVQRLWVLVVRGIFAALGVLCTFSALNLTSYANFSVLIYTNAIFGAAISTWYFREPFTPRHAVALLLTFGGIYLVMNPQWHGVNLGDLLALCAGIFFGVSFAAMREAGKTETLGSMTLSFYLSVAILATPVAWPHVHAVTWPVLGVLAVVMVAGTLAQIIESEGYRRCSVSVGGTLSYSALILQVVLGAWLFHEPLSWRFAAGAVLIVGGGIWVLLDRDPDPLLVPSSS